MKLVLVLAAVLTVAASASVNNKIPAAILRQNNDVRPDGSIVYGFESSDGIQRDEIVQQRQITPLASGSVMRGSYSYYGDDGKLYSVTYIADENGFQPSGAHLPVG